MGRIATLPEPWVIGSLDGASPSAPRDEAGIRGGVDEGLLMGGGRS
jgi:hypothetical protein